MSHNQFDKKNRPMVPDNKGDEDVTPRPSATPNLQSGTGVAHFPDPQDDTARRVGLNRERFPGLADGWVRADAPGGTQPLDACIAAMESYMASGRSANLHGQFAASQATDEIVAAARARVGALLGCDPGGVVFGPSMTALTFRFAQAVGATLRPGDRIVSTRLEHDANVRPWAYAAERAGAELALIDVDPETLDLDSASIVRMIDERTRWVAVGCASNAVGTVSDLAAIVARAREVGARVFVDAVAAAAHMRIDARAMGIDVVACSAYKWYGPHVGILAGAPELLGGLSPDRLAPAPKDPPASWELGTLPIEALAGVIAAVEYLEATGVERIAAQEDLLAAALVDGLSAIEGVRIYGAPMRRTPIAFFNVQGVAPREVAARLADRRIAATDGDVYAYELCRVLGLGPAGAVRLGYAHYSGLDDIERSVRAVAEIAAARPGAPGA